MNRFDRWSGSLGILLGLLFCVASYHLGLGQVSEPGPGFLPFIVGSALLLLSASILIRGWRQSREGKPEGQSRGNLRKVGLILLTLLFYNLVLHYIGFSLTTFIFVILLMRFVEFQQWAKTVLTALLITAGSYGVFQSWLKLDLPRGPWGF